MDSSIFSILPMEMIVRITDFLSIIDFMSFRLTCYDLSQIKIDYTKRIKKELEKYLSNEIIDSIYQNDIVITGSIMLKILYNAKWDPNDIDLYVEYNYSEQIDNFIDTIEKNNFKSLEKNESKNYIGSEYFKNTIDQNSLLINLVYLNHINPLKYIGLVADTEIGKVAFYKNKLYVKNWTKLIYKLDYIIPLSLIVNEIYYDDKPDYTDSLDKMYERLAKYTTRGFKLLVPKNLDEITQKLKNHYSNYVNDLNKCEEHGIFRISLSRYLESYHTDTSIFIREAALLENINLTMS